MSAIGKAFEPGHKAFIGFVTGGDPSLEQSEEYILEMIRAGADLVEIGVPFSDPIAEGPVIQEANLRALAAGTTLDKLFCLVERLRLKTAAPLVFLSYLNPVFHYGYERFFRRCQEARVDGLIVPDLPLEEQGEVRGAAAPYGVDLISLAAPSSQDRIKKIVQTAAGFLYVVSSMGVTGVRREIETDLAALIARIRGEAAGRAERLPVAVGFGIHTPAQASAIARLADGVIVGSGIVKIIAEHGAKAGAPVYRYVKEMKAAVEAARGWGNTD
ncbi:MAG: tryptophan synthase subunit alpha [Treponema sp.]|jgi:tryptophan synthase alpha chain|nr:tryptophan synthase subunit alpha [Treponema sp.]